MKILIIDDDIVIRQLLEDLLPLYLDGDVEVYSTADGQQGLEIAQRERPDVILLDAHMPGQNGQETAQLLRDSQETRHFRLVAMTGSGVGDLVSEGLKRLADDVLDKPFHPDALFNILASAGSESTSARAGSRLIGNCFRLHVVGLVLMYWQA